MTKTASSNHARDNRANQLNPNHPAYHSSRGHAPGEAQRLAGHDKSALDNHANQLNPNNAEYGGSSGVESTSAATGVGSSSSKSK